MEAQRGPRQPCTKYGDDPFKTNKLIECCHGHAVLDDWDNDGRYHYLCKKRPNISTPDNPCTPEGQNPKNEGRDFVQCCDDSRERNWTCIGTPEADLLPKRHPCTNIGDDPWATNKLVECCEGRSQLGDWMSDGRLHYLCVPDDNPLTDCTPDGESPLDEARNFKQCCGHSRDRDWTCVAPK